MATTFDERAEHQLEELHSLLKPVLDSAIKNVIGLEVATFPYVPPEYRGAIVATRNRLSNCLKALFEFFTAYQDLIVCYRVAANFPWQKGELTHHQHLSLAWSQFVNLCYLFEEKFKLVGNNYNAALTIFGIEDGRINVGDGTREIQQLLGEHIRSRGQHVHQWNAMHSSVKDFKLFETLRSVKSWPEDWPPFEAFYCEARDNLCADISAAVDSTHAILSGMLRTHGEPLAALINRYQRIVEGFKSLA